MRSTTPRRGRNTEIVEAIEKLRRTLPELRVVAPSQAYKFREIALLAVDSLKTVADQSATAKQLELMIEALDNRMPA